MKKLFYYSIVVIISILFVDGLCIMWLSEFSYFMSYLFTAFGIVGLIWLFSILYDHLMDKQ